VFIYKISNETTNEGQTRDMKDLAQKMLAGNDFIWDAVKPLLSKGKFAL